MTGIRVLFLVYPRFALDEGGLQVQVEETAARLGDTGVEVARWDVWRDQVPDVDVVHAFGLDSAFVAPAAHARSRRVPFVVSPVFNAFHTSARRLRAQVLAARRVPGLFQELRAADDVLRAADRVVCLNAEERALLAEVFAPEPARMTIVPNGVTEFEAGPPDPEGPVSDLIGSRYVVQVGRVTSVKNQLTSIRAVRGWPGRLVLVGRAGHGQDAYYEACRREAGPNVVFIDRLPARGRDLRSLYEGASAVLLPSTSEVMSLVLLEAVALRRPLVVSRQVPVPAFAGDRVPVLRVDPRSVAELRGAIEEAERTPPAGSDVAPMPTWADTASALRDVYADVVASGSRR